jgi:hypothetical protein
MQEVIYEPIQNSGLILKDPSPENYHSELFGKVGLAHSGIISPVKPPVIFPNGRGWLKVWHDYDYQELQFNNNFDTWSCVVYSLSKALCLYIYKAYGIKYTIAEMYNAFYAKVKEGVGTTIEDGAESLRTRGWVEDRDYPLTPQTTASEYFSEPPFVIRVKAEGKLKEWTIYWNVIPAVMDAIKTAYKRTPVVLTGYAWATRGDGLYIDGGRSANHAFLGLEQAFYSENNLISDTYPKNFQYVEQSQIGAGDLIKELEANFAYGSAHTIWAVPKNESLINKILKMFKKIKRDKLGGLWFIKQAEKDGTKFMGKQKIDSVLALTGALVDEVGAETVSDDYLSKCLNFKFFGK